MWETRLAKYQHEAIYNMEWLCPGGVRLGLLRRLPRTAPVPESKPLCLRFLPQPAIAIEKLHA
jgi:hypothetical protein